MKSRVLKRSDLEEDMRNTYWHPLLAVLCQLLMLDVDFGLASSLITRKDVRDLSARVASADVRTSRLSTHNLLSRKDSGPYAAPLNSPRDAGLQSGSPMQGRATRPIGQVAPTLHDSILRTRMYRFSLENRIQLVRATQVAMVVPVSIAASELERFYQLILREIITVWGLRPPVNLLVVTYGRLQLSFSMAPSNEVISWALVSSIVEELLEMTRSSFTPTFHSFWQAENHSASLMVVFDVLSTLN